MVMLARILLRPWRLIPLALIVAAVVAGLIYGSWVTAQARAVVVLSSTMETPVLTWAVDKLTDEPRTKEITIAGSEATLARPGTEAGPWPAIFIINGATPKGRMEPQVQGLAKGLARAGWLVVVADVPGLADGRLSPETVEGTYDAVRETADRKDVEGGDVALLGISVGATLALLTAEQPDLADRVSVIAGIAPYADLTEVLRIATTGYQMVDGRLEPYPADSFLSLVAARSVTSWLPPGPEREALDEELERIDDNDQDPLALFRTLPVELLSPTTAAAVQLLGNRNPERFDALYQELPAEVLAEIARFSPATGARALQAPIELAAAPNDPYIPIEQSQALIDAAGYGRLTVTEAFSHAVPQPSLTDPEDIIHFNGWVVRSLREAR